LINAIELHSKNSDRAKLFILHLFVRLVGIYKQQPLFTTYSKTAAELMKLDFAAVSDLTIMNLKNYSIKTI
jgi:hypothetical protein